MACRVYALGMARKNDELDSIHGYEFVSEAGVYVKRGLDPSDYFIIPPGKEEEEKEGTSDAKENNGKNTESQEESKTDAVEAMAAVLLLTKFIEPNESMVVEYLDLAIKDFAPKRKFVEQAVIGWNSLTHLERALYLSETKTLSGFLARERGVMGGIGDLLVGDTLNPNDDPALCMLVQYGFFPYSMMRYEPKRSGKDVMAWYLNNMHGQYLAEKGFGALWVMQVLIEDNFLPPRNEVELLLEHQTMKSRTLNIPKYPLINVDEALDIIYSKYPGAASMSSLGDSSGLVLKERALNVAKEFAMWAESDKHLEAVDDLAFRSVEEKIGRDDIGSKSLLDN